MRFHMKLSKGHSLYSRSVRLKYILYPEMYFHKFVPFTFNLANMYMIIVDAIIFLSTFP